jgi:hypothetical protein
MIGSRDDERRCEAMRRLTGMLVISCALTLLSLLLFARSAHAQGSVTPSFGTGTLVLEGEGYRSGERVEITVRTAGASHQFMATADARGRFRLDTALVVPPLSSVEIEARDEQGLTQAMTTSAPGGPPGSSSGNLPPAGPAPSSPLPTQLPRTGEIAGSAREIAGLAGFGAMMIFAGLLLGRRSPVDGR